LPFDKSNFLFFDAQKLEIEASLQQAMTSPKRIAWQTKRATQFHPPYQEMRNSSLNSGQKQQHEYGNDNNNNQNLEKHYSTIPKRLLQWLFFLFNLPLGRLIWVIGVQNPPRSSRFSFGFFISLSSAE
jgi:hypothetical protein